MPHTPETTQDELTAEEIVAALAFLTLVNRGSFTTSTVTKRVLIEQLALLTSMRTRALGLSVIEGNITTGQFIVGMSELIETGNISAGMIWAESSTLTFNQQAAVVGRINGQLSFLENFEQQIRDGTNKVNVAARAQQYGQAVRPTYYEVSVSDIEDQGFDLEENLLNPADHCEGSGSCVGETARGLVPIGDLIPIGNRICLSNCQCNKRYVNSSTGAVMIV